MKILRARSVDPALFSQALTPGVQETAQRYKDMPEEERARLADEGERRLDHLREELSRPASPSQDDDDFGDTGYLQPSR